jgi:hypothetical protein
MGTLYQKYIKILGTKSRYDLVHDAVYFDENSKPSPIQVIGKQQFKGKIDSAYKFTPEQTSAIETAYTHMTEYDAFIKFISKKTYDDDKYTINGFVVTRIEEKFFGFKQIKAKPYNVGNEYGVLEFIINLTKEHFQEKTKPPLGHTLMENPKMYITYRLNTDNETICYAYIEQNPASPFRSRRRGSKSVQRRRKLGSKSKSRKRSSKPDRR